MKNLIILITLSLLASCGLKVEYKKSLSIAPQTQAYVNNFEKMRGKKIDDLKVAFATMDSTIMGYCQRSSKEETKTFSKIITNTPEVYLNIHAWPLLTPLQREILINHELGHCILNREHKNDRIEITYSPEYSTTIQASVMNAYIFALNETSTIAYEGQYFSYYMAELFGKPIEAFASYSFSEENYKTDPTSLALISSKDDQPLIPDLNQPHMTREGLNKNCMHNAGKTIIHSDGSEEHIEESDEMNQTLNENM